MNLFNHFCFIKKFNKFYRKANDNSYKKLWTQKKEELNWDKDQRNQRYMFINYFNSNVSSKVYMMIWSMYNFLMSA